jgi:hypothetical protein
MAIEQRGARRCYYSKHRHDGKVISRYVACGDEAEAIAATVERSRAEAESQRAAERSALAAVQSLTSAATAALRSLDGVADAAMRAALADAGYVQHDRGEWRKRRAS